MIALASPKGHALTFEVRADTNDAALAHGILGEDEYDLRSLPPLTGWAIDIGAHIGTVAIALAVDHPGLKVVAVEALTSNADALRQSVALNGLDWRVRVEHGAAGSELEWAAGETVDIVYGWDHVAGQPDGYIRDSRYIGGMLGPNDSSTVESCPAISLNAIRLKYGIDRIALLKIDCEGCEWFVLTSPAVDKVDLILGEMHTGKHGGPADLRRLLEPTHVVEMDDSLNVAHFRAVHR